eukprot:UN21854
MYVLCKSVFIFNTFSYFKTLVKLCFQKKYLQSL